MNSATPVLLALLLVCSLPAIAVVAASPSHGGSGDFDEQQTLQHQTVEQTAPVEIENTSNQLPLTGDIRGSNAKMESNLGSAFASSTTQVQVDYEQYVLAEREFDSANETEQAMMIEDAYGHLNERIYALEEREKEAAADHASGDISDAEFLQELLRNYHEATALEQALDDLQTSDDLITENVLSSRQLRADRTVLNFHTTAIRTNIEAASKVDSTDEQYEFRLQTSQDGYRLSTLDDDTYVSETVRFDNRDSELPDQFEGFEANDRAMELYPWIDEQGGSDFHDRSAENLYLIDVPHEHGELEILLDGGTGDVYREAQDVSIDSLPTAETMTKTTGGFEWTIHETPALGPVELVVTDTETGEPLEAAVTMADVDLGTTDEDGSITYLPPSSSYELTTEVGTQSVNSTVSSD